MNRRKLDKNRMKKRGQVGITITWMVAFIIIFFIMLVFAAMSAIAGGKRQLNKNDISLIEEGFNKLEMQRTMVIFLNFPVEFKEEKIDFEELISRWGEDNGLKKEIEKKLEEYFKDESCYALIVEDPKKNWGNLFVYRGAIQKDNPALTSFTYSVGPSLIDERWIKMVLRDEVNKLDLFYLKC